MTLSETLRRTGLYTRPGGRAPGITTSGRDQVKIATSGRAPGVTRAAPRWAWSWVRSRPSLPARLRQRHSFRESGSRVVQGCPAHPGPPFRDVTSGADRGGAELGRLP